MMGKRISIFEGAKAKGCQKCCHSYAKSGHLNATFLLTCHCKLLIYNGVLVEAAGFEPASADSQPLALHA